jgi:tetratricopeptide (TPR) repeat protein
MPGSHAIGAHSTLVGRKINNYAFCRDDPLKNALAIVTLSTLLSACAGLHTQSAPTSVAVDKPVVADENVAAMPAQVENATPGELSAARLSVDQLPSIPLSRELMYQILAAEISFQRGDWQVAVGKMYTAAQQTRDPRLAQRAFEMAWIVKQADEALVASRLWRTLAPHSEEATQNYLNAVVMADRMDEAQPIFERLLRETPQSARGVLIFQIQRLLSHSKDASAAFTTLDNLMAPYADMTEAHIALAYGAFAKGDNERAKAEAQTALSSKADSEQAALILAQVNPDKNEALKFLAKFVVEHPTAKELRITYARILIEQKRYKEAQHEFETLIKSQPDDLTILYMLGILEIQTNDQKAAERHLTAFLDVLANHPNEDRDPTSALMLLSQIAEDRKDNDAALRWLDQVDSPDAYVGVQIRRAEIFGKEGNISGARKLLGDLAPPNHAQQIQVIAAEAQILRDASQPKEAMKVLATGIQRFPEDTDLLYDYAMDAEKNNQLDVCETSLRKIISLAPQNQQAYNALGYTFAERNIRLDEAFALVETAMKLAPDDPFIIDSMGWVQFRMGKLKEAEELLRRAYSIRQDPEIAVHLGEVLWTKGQKADAHKLWRDVGSKDPGNDSLKSTLARLHISL